MPRFREISEIAYEFVLERPFDNLTAALPSGAIGDNCIGLCLELRDRLLHAGFEAQVIQALGQWHSLVRADSKGKSYIIDPSVHQITPCLIDPNQTTTAQIIGNKVTKCTITPAKNGNFIFECGDQICWRFHPAKVYAFPEEYRNKALSDKEEDERRLQVITPDETIISFKYTFHKGRPKRSPILEDEKATKAAAHLKLSPQELCGRIQSGIDHLYAKVFIG